MLRKIGEDAEKYLGEEVTKAVISVPAYFDDNCRNATKLAAEHYNKYRNNKHYRFKYSRK